MLELDKIHQPEIFTERRSDRVLIIGAGFVGTATAIRLLHNATHPLEITLLEKKDEQRSGGIAFSSNNVGWELYLNIQSGRISAFREEPDDFTYWANIEADRTLWPPRWQNVIFHAYSGVARRMYQQYTEDRLEQAIQNSAPGVTLNRIRGEAFDVVEHNSYITTSYITSVETSENHTKHIDADQTVIATGHVDFTMPEATLEIKNNPHFVNNQYSEHGQNVIRNLGKYDTAFIIGSGLSAFDACISLLSYDHKGSIVMNSRHGYTHFTYPEDHIHDIIQVDRPLFLDDADLTIEKVIAGGEEEFKKIADEFRNEKPEIPQTIYTERIMKAWEPYIAELVQRLPANDVQELLTRFRSLSVASRIGTIPEIGNKVAEAMIMKNGQPPQVKISIGHIQEMFPTDDGKHISVSIIDSKTLIRTVVDASVVINTTGQEADYTKINSPLWRNLIDVHKSAVPHKKTRRGIEVGNFGEIINANDEKTSLLSVGPMRQGDETERRGRLGAFVFSLGTIKNQAFEVAIEILQRLEDKRVESDGMSLLGLTANSENPTSLITKHALSVSQLELTEQTEAYLEEKISNVVDILLADELIIEEQKIFINKDPLKREKFRLLIENRTDELAGELDETGLEHGIVIDILRAANKQREKIALLKLTDIAYLQEPNNRRGNILRTF